MNSICLNGKILPADQPALMADNKSYRYGDGLFETMKVLDGQVILEKYHFERFVAGLRHMVFDIPVSATMATIRQDIIVLCEKNKCQNMARVRLSAFRGSGGLYEPGNDLHYLIECWPLDASVNELNPNGLEIDIYPHARKSCDKFSNLKSASYLPYVMAARYAVENKLDDCLVLNTHDRVADSTIANIFLIKNEKMITPPLSEGCVNGVMRRWMIEQFKVEETGLTVEDILSAGELFFTNAIYGLRWVKQFRQKTYTNLQAAEIHAELRNAIWA